MKKIKCCDPRFILDASAKKNLLRADGYIMRGIYHAILPVERERWFTYFPYRKFSAKLNGISYDNIDDYGIVIGDEILPMYMAVPCGKCALCRERKANDWCLRCACETNEYDCPPCFITLTYAPENLPSDGVNKKDCQMFLDRLRSNLRRAGYSNKIRYFLVAEYGKNTHRAHYHAIVWNMPNFERLKDLLACFEVAWKNGFVYCSICNNGASAYCMKYMRKEIEVPAGQNDVFYLVSRGREKGGLGKQYALRNADMYLNNADFNSIEIVDKFTNQKIIGSIPQYFKRIWSPSMCNLVPKEIRDAYNMFNYSVEMIRLFRTHFPQNNKAYEIGSPDDTFACLLNRDVDRITSKFAVLDIPWVPLTCFPDYVDHFFNKEIVDPETKRLHASKLVGSQFGMSLSECWSAYYTCVELLNDYQLDADKIWRVLNSRAAHRANMDAYFETQPDLDIAELVVKLEAKKLNRSRREKF